MGLTYKRAGQMFLYRLRQELGLTQDAFAAFFGVERITIQAWESGRRWPRQQHILQVIALASPSNMQRLQHDIRTLAPVTAATPNVAQPDRG